MKKIELTQGVYKNKSEAIKVRLESEQGCYVFK